MSFRVSDLSVLAYANNFTQWHYITKDESVLDEDYFNNASDMLNVNDLIIVQTGSDGDVYPRPRAVTEFYVVIEKKDKNLTVERIK